MFAMMFPIFSCLCLFVISTTAQAEEGHSNILKDSGFEVVSSAWVSQVSRPDRYQIVKQIGRDGSNALQYHRPEEDNAEC